MKGQSILQHQNWCFMVRVFGGFALCLTSLQAQFVYFESFRDETAPGWTLTEGGTTPGARLTAGATPTALDPESGDPELDTSGNGWLRLGTTTGNQDNAAYLDTSIPSSANEITISFDFTAWDTSSGTGADGLSVFLWDADVTYDEGANGGSLSYAQKTGVTGLDGAFVGVGLDVFGNFSNATEGRTGSDPSMTSGGSSANPGFLPNQVVVRGPDDSVGQDGTGNYYYLAGTGGNNYTTAGDDAIQDLVDFNPGNGNLAFPTQDFRPDQDATQFRRFEMTLDENDMLTVSVEFGFGTGLIDLYTVDLSTFTRPENLRIGFGAATGGVNQVYEVRNLLVTADGFDDTWYWTDAQLTNDRLWSSATNWTPQSVPGEAGNLYADVVFTNEFSTSPLEDATITVDGGDKTLADIFFSGQYGFTLDPDTNQTFIMDTNGSGASEINVLNNPEGNADHAINLDLDLQNNLEVNNLVDQSLTFTGDIDSNGNDITVNSVGTTTMSGVVSEGADVVKEGNGTLVLSGSNTYTGTTTITDGIIQIENSNGLGNSSGDTVVQDGGTLALAGGISVPVGEQIDIAGAGEGGIGAISNTSGSNTWAGDVDLTADSTIGAQAGTLTFNSADDIDAAGFDLTFNTQSGSTIDVERVITDSSGTSDMIVEGEGTTIFNANNTYSGETIVNGGTLQIENAGGLGDTTNGTTVNDGGTLAFANGVTISSAETYTVTGNGTTGKASIWNESGNNEIDGQVTITGGSATFGAEAGSQIRIDGGVAGVDQDAIITGDGTVVWANPNSYTGDTIINSGTLLFEDGDNRINDASDVIVNSGGLLDMNNRSDTVGSISGAGNIDLGNATLTAGGNNVDTTFSGDISGTGNVTKAGTGITTFSGSNTFSGELSVDAGTVAIGADDVFSDSMDLRLDGGTFSTDGFADTLDNLILDSNSIIDFMGTTGGFLTFDDMTRNGGTLTVDNWSGSLSGTGNTRLLVTASSLGGDLINNIDFAGYGGAQLINISGSLYEVVPTITGFAVWDDGSGNNQWESGANWVGDVVPTNAPGAQLYFGDDAGNSQQTVVMNGNGRTVGNMIIDGTGNRNYRFRANNGAQDLTFDNNGSQATLIVTGTEANSIGFNNNANRRVNVVMDDDLLISNNSTAATGLTFGTSNGGHTFDTNGNALNVTGSSTTIIHNQITDTGSITLDGPGTLNLTDTNNTYSGGTILNDGTLVASSDAALGTGALTINGGTLSAGSADRTLTNTYAINNSFTVGDFDGSDLELSGNGTIATGDQSVTVDTGLTFTVSGDLTGAGAFVKEGDGTTIFSGDNSTFSGGLTVNDGTVQTNATTAVTLGGTQANENYLGTGDITVSTGGTLDIDTTQDVDLVSGTTFTNTGGTVTVDAGTDFFQNGNFDQSDGATTINVTDDYEVGSGASLAVSGGTVTINADDQFATSGGGGTVSVSNGGTLNVDISAVGGAEDNFFLNQNDTLTVDGSGTALNITGEADSNIDLEGRVNITNSGIIEVFAGETNLSDTTILDGGSSGTPGTLIVHGDLNIQTPGLANDPNITINADSGDTEIASISGTESIENIGTLTKTGVGTTTINSSVNNIQADNILINGGTLLNGASDQIENETPMELAGAEWSTGGFDEVLGTLTLSDTSTIDLGNGDSVVNFADSSSEGWTGDTIAYVENWTGSVSGGGTDQLIFGSTNAALTQGQLNQIVFVNPAGFAPGWYSAQILSTGEVVPLNPVPEPSTYAFGGALVSFLLWRERKRLRSYLSRLKSAK